MGNGKVIIGIDPGKTGAACIIYDNKVRSIICFSGYLKNDNWVELIIRLQEEFEDANIIVLERSHSFPKQGVAASFNYGVTYGILKGLCLKLLSEYLLASNFKNPVPSVWMKDLGLIKKGGKRKGDKTDNIKRACKFFPGLKKETKTYQKEVPDAVLLAFWGRDKK